MSDEHFTIYGGLAMILGCLLVPIVSLWSPAHAAVQPYKIEPVIIRPERPVEQQKPVCKVERRKLILLMLSDGRMALVGVIRTWEPCR